jgi:NADH-quinone oxidoreductase subunit J
VDRLVFEAAAAVTIVFAALMVLSRNPVKSVLSLVVAFFSLAVCYVLLFAPFIAVIQVIVYAGAILVLFLFVLMLLNVGPERPERTGRPIQTLLSGVGIVLFAGFLLSTLRHSGSAIPRALAAEPNVLAKPEALARELFGGYLLHFEAISILLLAALVGAFVLARRDRKSSA